VPSQITAPSEHTSQVHSLIPNILASMNKPTVTNVYFRAGTSTKETDYMTSARILRFQYIFRVVLWMIS